MYFLVFKKSYYGQGFVQDILFLRILMRRHMTCIYEYTLNTVNLNRRMWWQRNIDQYWTVYANNRLHEYLYIAAAFIVPEVLALLLFILPWVRNFVENSNWRIFHVLTWWFQVCTILVLLLLHLVSFFPNYDLNQVRVGLLFLKTKPY